MRIPRSAALVILSGLVCACAGFRGGWESVPFAEDAPPPPKTAETPFESRERMKLRLDGVTLEVVLENQIRTYDTQVYLFILPLSVDPRTVRTTPVIPGRTRVRITVSDMRDSMIFQPELAELTVGDRAVRAVSGHEFGMWDTLGQRVASGGKWDDRAIDTRLVLEDRTRRHLLRLDFPVDAPSPEMRGIMLDLSKALTAPGRPPLPRIHFAPGRWKHGYT